MMMPIKPILRLLAPPGQHARLSILIYHRVLPEPDPLRPDEPDAETFRWQMRLLARQFRPLPLSVAVAALAAGRLPARAVCVTFDDGYADNAEIALPILQEAGITATFFIATGYLDGGRMFNDTVIETVRRLPAGQRNDSDIGLGRYALGDVVSRIRAYRDILERVKYLPGEVRAARVAKLSERLDAPLPDNLMMRQEQVRHLSHAGMEIGAHTMNHPILARLSDAEAREEIDRGRQALEALIGQPVRLFAYPNGQPGRDYLARHAAMVRELGFAAAVSTAPGAARLHSDRFQLPRFTPWDRMPWRFTARLARNLFVKPKTAPDIAPMVD